jgi:hypothetical protein
MRLPRLWLFLLFLVGTILIYLPTIGNGFMMDDYAALYRILIEKRILYREFLRPWIDISFYLNWMISGLHPEGYHLFNFAIHALTTYMVYRVVAGLPFLGNKEREMMGVMAGVLFLFYPFHNEGVVWLAGRLSSMAALFGLLALHFHLTFGAARGFWLAVLCWYVGLFAYESIIVLPLIVLVLEWMVHRDRRRFVRLAVAWGAAGGVWLVMRAVVAGALSGYYTSGTSSKEGLVLRTVKAFGRCFLPPVENARMMVFLFAGLIIGLGLVSFLLWRRSRAAERRHLGGAAADRRLFLGLAGIFLISLLPAFTGGVSTRTTEGDRLLYFPSCFLCMLIGASLFVLVTRNRWRMAIVMGLAAAGFFFIEANNRRWVFASKAAASVYDAIRAAPGRVVLVNAPDEWEGAYIFRNNFKEGLVVNGIDTNKVVAPHFLMRLEYLPVKDRIEPVWKDSSVFIFPATRIVVSGGRFGVGSMSGSFDARTDRVFYWDKFELKPLNLLFNERAR